MSIILEAIEAIKRHFKFFLSKAEVLKSCTKVKGKSLSFLLLNKKELIIKKLL